MKLLDLIPSERWDDLAVVFGLLCIGAYAAAVLATRLVRRGLESALLARPSAGGPGAHPMTSRSARLVGLTVFAAVVLLALVPALRMVGLLPATDPAGALEGWLHTVVRIAFIAAGAYVFGRVAGTMADELGRAHAGEGEPAPFDDRARRVRTLAGLVRKALTSVIAGVAGLMVLRELNVDIMPVLTGAGILGLGVGFGAQSLIRDVMAGFFLILENQVRVGDAAVINGISGVVEEVNLRTIVLRDVEGSVHVVANGSIATLANRSRDYAYAVVDVGVAYDQDLDRIEAVLDDIGHRLAADSRVAPLLVEPLEVLGVEAFREAQMALRVRIKTLPLRQGEVARELRRRIKNAFDEAGIEMPARAAAVPMPRRDPRRPAS